MSKQIRYFYEFGPFRLDAAERLLLRDGRPVPLTPKVFDILLVLVRNSGHLLDKEELMRAVWPDSFVEEGNLTRNVSTLRTALGDGHGEHQYIETVPRRGYRFVAGVREVNGGADLVVEERSNLHIIVEEKEETYGRDKVEQPPSSAGATADGSGGQVPAEAIKEITARIRGVRAVRLKKYMALGVAALVTALVAATYFYSARTGKAIDSVAVLPFVNAGADPDTEYLSDGITESLINGLSQLSELRVIARSSVFRYKGREVDIQAVGRELGVSAVLTGRVMQRGDGLSISVELTDVRNNSHLWGERYERRFSNILATQEDIASEIAEKLRLRLTGEEQQRLTRRYTDNDAAYQLYLRGRYFWNKRTEEGMRRSVEYFNRAIELDPTYALAYAGLADAHNMLAIWDYLPQQEGFHRGKAAAARALEIDNSLAEAHAALAYANQLYDWDFAAADREFRLALELKPNYALARKWYAEFLSMMGRHEEAIREIKRAQELDPLSLIINRNVGDVFYYARRYDQAIEQYQRTIELDHAFVSVHNRLGRAYAAKGMFDEAVAEFLQEETVSGSSREVVEALRGAYAVSGWRGFWRRMLKLKTGARRGPVSPYKMAEIHSVLGEKDQAFARLNRACERHEDGWLVYLNVDPWFDDLRSDPRFVELLRKIGLTS